MRVLYLDIETAPLEVYTWGLRNQFIGINQIAKPTSIISFAAKWRGKKNKMYFDIHTEGHAGMIDAAHGLLDECDVLCTYNGNKFDIKHLKREMVQAGLNPPSPFKSLDLYLAVRSQFAFPSNKLGYVAPALGLSSKVSHSGFDLWLQFIAGDEKARKKFREYNIRDVVLLEELHDRILPYIQNHPHYGVHTDPERPSCPRCGSGRMQSRGFAVTQLGRYRRFQCGECGGWMRGKRAVDTVEMRAL